MYRIDFGTCSTVQQFRWNVSHCKNFPVRLVKFDRCSTVRKLIRPVSQCTNDSVARVPWYNISLEKCQKATCQTVQTQFWHSCRLTRFLLYKFLLDTCKITTCKTVKTFSDMCPHWHVSYCTTFHFTRVILYKSFLTRLQIATCQIVKKFFSHLF